jgi:hypothetical protein
MGYWAKNGFGNLVKNSANNDITTSSPQTEQRPRSGHWNATGYETGNGVSNSVIDSLIASEGHHKDYWAPDLGPGYGANIDRLQPPLRATAPCAVCL